METTLLNTKDLRESSIENLMSLLEENQANLVNTNAKHALGQLRETHSIGIIKKNIARIKTCMSIMNNEANKGTK